VGALAPTADPAHRAAAPLTAKNSIDRNLRDHARASAVAALAAIGGSESEAQKTLVSLAEDPVPEVRMAVARAIGELDPGTPGALAAELKLASDSDMYIRARAVTALGNFPQDYQRTCPVLYRAYQSGQRPLQEGAELSLEKIVKSGKFAAQAARHSSDPALRFAAVFGLNPSSDHGLKAILQALKDEDPGVRLLAVTRLGKAPASHAKLALESLESLANDKDGDVRNQVRFAQKSLAPRRRVAARH
jgi:HEAT repeat protein